MTRVSERWRWRRLLFACVQTKTEEPEGNCRILNRLGVTCRRTVRVCGGFVCLLMATVSPPLSSRGRTADAAMNAEAFLSFCCISGEWYRCAMEEYLLLFSYYCVLMKSVYLTDWTEERKENWGQMLTCCRGRTSGAGSESDVAGHVLFSESSVITSHVSLWGEILPNLSLMLTTAFSFVGLFL